MKRSLSLTVISAACLCAAAQLALPAHAEEAKLTGWKTENGKRYYYDADGKKVTGEVKIDGVTYLFAPNGAQQLGWQTVDGKRYFYNKKGEAVFGWLEWRGESYYVSRENGKLTGRQKVDEVDVLNFDEFGVCSKWQTNQDGKWTYLGADGELIIDDEPYLFTKDGILLTGLQKASDGITRYYDAETHEIKTGWITEAGKRLWADPEKGVVNGWITDDKGKHYYIDAEKGMLSGWQVIDGKQYKLLETGEMYTGMYTVNGKTYLFAEDGVMATGFTETDAGIRYFGSNGVMLTGLNKIGEDTYYFNADGIMQVGFQDILTADGRTARYFFDSEGKSRTGWITVGDKKYYVDPNGSLKATPTTVDGKTYLFDQNGEPVIGWYTDSDSGKKYYAGADGVLVTGWQTIGGKKYYFDGSFVMAASPTVINGKTYLFNKDGSVATGWYTAASGSKSYAGADGMLVTGWQTIENVKYYFDANGIMAAGPTVIGGKTYLFNADGKTASGLYTAANGKKYYAGADGLAQTGWQELPNQSSYFGADGVMAVSTTVDGYTIDANGSARSQRAIIADKYIANSDKTVNGVYKSFYGPNYYDNYGETPRTTDQLLNAGWDKLIDSVFSRNKGICYYLAAALDFVFQRAGFETRVVYAWHGSHHYWVQVNINGTWWNYDPTYRYERSHLTWAEQNQMDKNRGGTGYTLRGYVHAKYNHKGDLISATYEPV